MTDNTVTVPVKETWFSKINWTQVGSMVVMGMTMMGIVVPPDLEKAALATLIAISGFATIIFRTYFNGTVTPQSVGKT